MGRFDTPYLPRRTSPGFVSESARRCGDTRFRFRQLRIESVKALQNLTFDTVGELLCVHRRTSPNL